MSPAHNQQWRLQQTDELLKIFSSALRSRGMYPEGHPILEANCRRFIDVFETMMADNLEHWTIVLLGGEFLYERVPLSRISEQAQPLYRAMAGSQIQSITMYSGVTTRELSRFISLLVADSSYWKEMADVIGGGGSDANLPHIVFKRVEITADAQDISTNTDDARGTYAALKKDLTAFTLSIVGENARPAWEPLEAAKESLWTALKSDRLAMISRLHTRHDPDDLIGHCLNTTIVAYVTAKQMGADENFLSELLKAGMLFDVGMPDPSPRIVNGVLRASADKNIFREHPVCGASILARSANAPMLAYVVAFEHHARWDGAGFPQLPGRKMNLASALVAAASAYDELLHGDPPLPPEEAAQRLAKMTGGDLEPRIVAHLLSALGAYPPGTFVKLTNGEVALAAEPTPADIFRPVVKVLKHADGSPALTEVRRDLTNKQAGGAYVTSVQRSIPPHDAK
jgi:HD-GYP domain-containing protein (c-di-GMP phosphodiesterase class II)